MNKNIFKTVKQQANVPVANAINNAGGVAYSLSDEEALAQLAVTGTFNGTYYSSGEDTLKDLLSRAQKVSPEFLARLAVYSRKSAFMKDSSAVLLAVLMTKDSHLFSKVFNLVVDNGKMLRNFVQVVRSGQVGRKSFGTAPKRLIRNWLENRKDEALFDDSVGNTPSLADVIKMVHPVPSNPTREALYAYLIGKTKNQESLPPCIKEFEVFKNTAKGSRKVPNVNFQMLTALDLSETEWTDIAKTAPWHMTRMNLNTFERHGVFKNNQVTDLIAKRLSDAETVKRVKVFPYQLYTAFLMATTVPSKVRNALQNAMEVATQNTPHISGKVYVGVDCSGSMCAPVTGNRGSATTAVTCNNVAALMAACVLRNSDDCEVYRFDTTAQKVALNSRDSVMTNASKIGTHGGGTDCGAMLRLLNALKAKGDVVFIVSDNESWSNQYSNSSSNLMREWVTFKARNPNAKLVNIDLAANTTMQTASQKDVLNVGGFSDGVFQVVASFLENNGKTTFRDTIMSVSLDN